MKKGVNFWSFADGISFEEAVAQAKAAGFDGIELVMNEQGPLSLESTDEEVIAIRDLFRREGMETYSLATSLFWKYSLCDNDPEIVEKGKRLARRMIDFAALLGCTSILMVPGAVKEDIPYDVAYERSLAACMEIRPYAEEKKIHVGIENVWNKFLLSPLEFRDFIKKIDSEYMNAYFDVGNVQVNGFPEHWIRILGGLIDKIHIKDFRNSVGNIEGFVDLLSGDVNFPAVIKALKDVGYDGWITAEVCPPSKYCPLATLTNISNSMDVILGR